MKKILTAFAIVALGYSSTVSAETIFDDFNVDEGHFNVQPSFSGSNRGLAATSTADRVETDGPLEGLGHQQLVLDAISVGITNRHLSGSGSAANNTAFTTGAGTDGWIGFFVKTTSPGWQGQLWIEGASVNFGTFKPLIADGLWHAYEWNLDDFSGGADGWGSGIIGGSATVTNGNHTIDSIVFQNNTATGSSTLFLDFVARNELGSITTLSQVPEPSTVALGLIGGAGLLVGYFRRRAKK